MRDIHIFCSKQLKIDLKQLMIDQYFGICLIKSFQSFDRKCVGFDLKLNFSYISTLTTFSNSFQ